MVKILPPDLRGVLILCAILIFINLACCPQPVRAEEVYIISNNEFSDAVKVNTAIAGSPQGSEYSGATRDMNRVASMKINAEKYVSNRSILWVEKEYLSTEGIKLLHQRIDKAIKDTEDFIDLKFDEGAYQKKKIEYFVYNKREISHTMTGNQPRKYMHPVIFLTHGAEKIAPYVHETVHIIAWDWNSLWLKEGLAVFLNDKLNGYPAFPNYGVAIDKVAQSKLHFRSALLKVGRNGIPEFSDKTERRVFYTLSGSFVKYLYAHIGREKFMKLYKTKDTRQAFFEITGKKLDVWKKEWITGL